MISGLVERLTLLKGKERQYFYHAVAVNWLEEEKDTREVLAWHNQRGQVENFNNGVLSPPQWRGIREIFSIFFIK